MANTIENKTTTKVNTPITIDLGNVAGMGTHVFIGLKFIDSAGLTVTPSSGTFTFEVLPTGMDTLQSIVDGTDIVANGALSLLSYSANTDKVVYTPNTIVGADRIVITITANEN